MACCFSSALQHCSSTVGQPHDPAPRSASPPDTIPDPDSAVVMTCRRFSAHVRWCAGGWLRRRCWLWGCSFWLYWRHWSDRLLTPEPGTAAPSVVCGCSVVVAACITAGAATANTGCEYPYFRFALLNSTAKYSGLTVQQRSKQFAGGSLGF